MSLAIKPLDKRRGKGSGISHVQSCPLANLVPDQNPQRRGCLPFRSCHDPPSRRRRLRHRPTWRSRLHADPSPHPSIPSNKATHAAQNHSSFVSETMLLLLLLPSLHYVPCPTYTRRRRATASPPPTHPVPGPQTSSVCVPPAAGPANAPRALYNLRIPNFRLWLTSAGLEGLVRLPGAGPQVHGARLRAERAVESTHVPKHTNALID